MNHIDAEERVSGLSSTATGAAAPAAPPLVAESAVPSTVVPEEVYDPESFFSSDAGAGETPDELAASAERRSTVLLRAGLAASTIGLCLLLFIVYVYVFSAFQQHRQQHILLNDYTATNRVTILTKTNLSDGQPAGILKIPAIGLNQVMVQGTNATDLLKGPGLMPGTARPGSLGNAVIAGHRTIAGSPFANISHLRQGDRIFVFTPPGKYRYTVIAVGTTHPGGRDPTSPNRHPRLTLVTSNPYGSGRLYVVAALRSAPNRLPIPRHPPTASERGLTGDSSAILPSVLWGLLLAAVFALTLWCYWRFRGRHWTVYLLSTPVLLALTFVWYGSLIRLLPGTM